MTKMILMIMTMNSGILFSQMSHPLAMGLTLLVQTLLICLMTGMMSKSFWFSYILFLIFLGGMLVLFIYVTALASNEMFSMSMNSIFSTMMIMLFTMIIYLIIDPMMISQTIENIDSTSITNMKSFNLENTINLNKLYNFPTNMITIMLMNYLLITLVVVVKITNVFYGPLRKMN